MFYEVIPSELTFKEHLSNLIGNIFSNFKHIFDQKGAHFLLTQVRKYLSEIPMEGSFSLDFWS